MRRLPRRLDVADPLVLAVDALVRDDRLESIDRIARRVERRARARVTVALDERGRIELETGQHLAAVARARPPADILALDDENRCADAREMACGRQTRIGRADQRDVS